MKNILRLFIVFTIFFIQATNTFGALYISADTPCSEQGYVFENGQYSYNTTYQPEKDPYGKYARSLIQHGRKCSKREKLGSKILILSEDSGYLISNNGIYYEGNGYTYKKLLTKMISLLIYISILYLIHFALFHSLKYIKKYKLLKIFFGTISLLGLIYLGLLKLGFALSVYSLRFYYDININMFILLFFFFSLLSSFIQKEKGIKYKETLPSNKLIFGAIILHMFWFLVNNLHNPEILAKYHIIWFILSIVLFTYYIRKIIPLYKTMEKGIKFEKILIVFFIFSLINLFLPIINI